MKFLKKEIQFLYIISLMLSSTLMAQPQAETTFRGNAEGIFLKPTGGGNLFWSGY